MDEFLHLFNNMTKAFELLSHDKLKENLKGMRIWGESLNWISSYLQNLDTRDRDSQAHVIWWINVDLMEALSLQCLTWYEHQHPARLSEPWTCAFLCYKLMLKILTTVRHKIHPRCFGWEEQLSMWVNPQNTLKVHISNDLKWQWQVNAICSRLTSVS